MILNPGDPRVEGRKRGKHPKTQSNLCSSSTVNRPHLCLRCSMYWKQRRKWKETWLIGVNCYVLQQMRPGLRRGLRLCWLLTNTPGTICGEEARTDAPTINLLPPPSWDSSSGLEEKWYYFLPVTVLHWVSQHAKDQLISTVFLNLFLSHSTYLSSVQTQEKSHKKYM